MHLWLMESRAPETLLSRTLFHPLSDDDIHFSNVDFPSLIMWYILDICCLLTWMTWLFIVYEELKRWRSCGEDAGSECISLLGGRTATEKFSLMPQGLQPWFQKSTMRGVALYSRLCSMCLFKRYRIAAGFRKACWKIKVCSKTRAACTEIYAERLLFLKKFNKNVEALTVNECNVLMKYSWKK